MWPWARKSEPDPLLGEVKSGVIAAIGTLFSRLDTIGQQLKLLDESATSARAIELRLNKVEALATASRSLLEQEISRIDSAVVQVRGVATGGQRDTRSKRNREAEDVGEKFLASLQDPEKLQALIRELQSLSGASVDVAPVAGIPVDRAAIGVAMMNGG